MDQELNAMGMLDLMVRPGFCVKDQKIIKCNTAAESLLISPGMEIGPMLATGEAEYAEFSGGTLYLTVRTAGTVWGASITRMGDWDIFLLEESADRAELQAMALAARELRDPLAGIMTTAERLFPVDTLEKDPDLREQAARLNRGLYQMLRILSNMSDAGNYAVARVSEMETVDIMKLYHEVFQKIQSYMNHTGLTLRFENLTQSLFCLADPEKLERAVMNMISNAIKFTPAGGTIEARLHRRGIRLYLSIQDSGEGIPEGIRSSIHSRYLRQPGLEDSRYGIGLGMVLIRSAAAIHGGTVLIDHPENCGTRITMTMRIRQNTAGNVRYHNPARNPLHIDYAGERDHALLELSEILTADFYDPPKIN